jgi:predicted ATPase/DNA-binding CsgD family transcriptional regulator
MISCSKVDEYILKESLLVRGQADSHVRKAAGMQDNLLTFPQPSRRLGSPVPRFLLPSPLTPLIDRKQEVTAICNRLGSPEVRLLTLTGTGGVGKTRLALAVAQALQHAFADGVSFVPLAAIHDANEVIPAIAQALGLQPGSRPIFEVVQGALRYSQFLLVLDNFEQVVQAAPALTSLLTSCEGVRMLVTSRESLHVDGEHEYPILPLPVPENTRGDVGKLAENPAVALFLQRVLAIQPDFQFAVSNASTIADICVHLEGLPLALELAAARSKLFPPAALLTRISQRLPFLTSGARSALPRQQTLRNTIAWSYDLLSGEEQTLFRRLCIFIGGWTLPAVAAIYHALDGDSARVEDGIAALMDKSLILKSTEENGEVRFQMLETIREFGLECLQESDEWERVRLAHADYYLNWTETSRKALYGSRQWIVLQQYIQEQGNWRAVMRYVIERRDTEAALRLAGGLSIFWLIWGYSYDQLYLIEGRDFLEYVLRESEGMETSARAWALSVFGGALALLRDLERSFVACHAGLALARKLGDTQYIITGLWMLLLPLITRDDFKAAFVAVEEAVALAKAPGFRAADWSKSWLLGYSLHRAGYVALWQGQYARAREMLAESITLSLQENEQFFTLWSNLLLGEAEVFEGQANAARERLESVLGWYIKLQLRTQAAEILGFLGLLALRQGDVEVAFTRLTENVQLRLDVGDAQGLAWAEIWQARAEFSRRNLDEARRLLSAGLSRAIQAHSRLYTAMGLEELGKVVALQGELEWATQLFGAAEALREEMGVPVPPVERPDYDLQVEAVRAELGAARFHAAWTQGRLMTPWQVFNSGHEVGPASPLPAQHLSVSSSSSHRADTWGSNPPDAVVRLTRRERDVLRLLAQGLTNAQIAEELVISHLTVNAHMRSIYRKLPVNTRVQAARYALDHHLL